MTYCSLPSFSCSHHLTILRFDNHHQEWQLIYKASTDGFSSQTFHEKCDDFPKTLTIVQVRKYLLIET